VDLFLLLVAAVVEVVLLRLHGLLRLQDLLRLQGSLLLRLG
jgi:hypothetical protein